VTPPPYRFDITIEEDLIEEVVRIIGYDKLPTTPPLAPITAKLPPNHGAAAFALAGCSPPWATRKPSTSASSRKAGSATGGQHRSDPPAQPIASQMSVMRSSLLGSLLQALKFNLDRKAERVADFELGRVFMRDARRDDDRRHRARHPPADAGGGAGLW
jgi:phenylalanyl-tRNA synthetase beta chain